MLGYVTTQWSHLTNRNGVADVTSTGVIVTLILIHFTRKSKLKNLYGVVEQDTCSADRISYRDSGTMFYQSISWRGFFLSSVI